MSEKLAHRICAQNAQNAQNPAKMSTKKNAKKRKKSFKMRENKTKISTAVKN